MSDVLEFVLRLVFEFVFHFVGYWTGRPLVLLFSAGHLRVDEFMATRPDERRWWKPLTYRRGGRKYLDGDFVALIGILFWVAVIGAYFLWRYYSPASRPDF